MQAWPLVVNWRGAVSLKHALVRSFLSNRFGGGASGPCDRRKFTCMDRRSAARSGLNMLNLRGGSQDMFPIGSRLFLCGLGEQRVRGHPDVALLSVSPVSGGQMKPSLGQSGCSHTGGRGGAKPIERMICADDATGAASDSPQL